MTNWISGRPWGFWIETVAEGPGVLDSVTVMEPNPPAETREEGEAERSRATASAPAAATKRSGDDDDRDIVFCLFFLNAANKA